MSRGNPYRGSYPADSGGNGAGGGNYATKTTDSDGGEVGPYTAGQQALVDLNGANSDVRPAQQRPLTNTTGSQQQQQQPNTGATNGGNGANGVLSASQEAQVNAYISQVGGGSGAIDVNSRIYWTSMINRTAFDVQVRWIAGNDDGYVTVSQGRAHIVRTYNPIVALRIMNANTGDIMWRWPTQSNATTIGHNSSVNLLATPVGVFVTDLYYYTGSVTIDGGTPILPSLPSNNVPSGGGGGGNGTNNAPPAWNGPGGGGGGGGGTIPISSNNNNNNAPPGGGGQAPNGGMPSWWHGPGGDVTPPWNNSTGGGGGGTGRGPILNPNNPASDIQVRAPLFVR